MAFTKKEGTGRSFANTVRKSIVYIIVGIVMLGCFMYLYTDNLRKNQTVDVIQLNSDVGPGTLITGNMISKKTKSASEYDPNTEIPWQFAENYVVNKYAAVYVAEGVALRDTWFLGESVEKLAYLREMEKDEELATIPYDSAYAGGNLLRPGDHIKLYASYIPTDANGQPLEGNKKATVEVVFNDITVTDLLNSNKNSILSIIEDAQSLPLDKREELMKSDDFQNDLSPKYLMIILKSDQAMALQQIMGSEKIKLTANILTRNRPEGQRDIITGNLLSTYLERNKKSSNE